MRLAAAIAELLSLGHMRTSLSILALALCCIGCREKQTSPPEVIPAVPVADLSELRPSFFDSNNMAEYYGRCPKCQRWVKGYFSHEDYGDASGKLVGGASGVTGLCEPCRIHLRAQESWPLTNDSRMVTWRVR